eukprot:4080296-Amphidinium_carterae.5
MGSSARPRCEAVGGDRRARSRRCRALALGFARARPVAGMREPSLTRSASGASGSTSRWWLLWHLASSSGLVGGKNALFQFQLGETNATECWTSKSAQYGLRTASISWWDTHVLTKFSFIHTMGW